MKVRRKKVLLVITETLLGSLSTISWFTLSVLNPGVGVIFSSTSALLTSIAILITNEIISKLKIRSGELKDWNNVFSLV